MFKSKESTTPKKKCHLSGKPDEGNINQGVMKEASLLICLLLPECKCDAQSNQGCIMSAVARYGSCSSSSTFWYRVLL